MAATARLHDRSGTLGADALQASIGTRGAGTWLELSGDVLELADLKGVRLEAEFGVASLRDLQPYATRTLPDVGPLTGAAGLADADGSLGVEHLRVTGGRADVLEIDVRGAFEDVRAWNEIDVRVRASARDLALVGALVDAELPPVGPVEVDVSARGSDELLEWTGRTRLDKTQLEGSWSLQFAPGTRPLLSGIVTSPQIYLDDIGIEPRADREPPLRGTDWLQTPIPFESLRLFDAKLVLDAHQVLGRNGLELSEVDASARLEDGRLSLDAIEVVYESGRVRASGTIDARSAVPSLALRADARRVDLSLLLAQIVERREDAGVLSGELDLRSAGGTPDELLRRLEGTLALELREASLASRYARRFVSNLVSVSMPRLSFRSAPTVGCATLRIVADAGVARVEELRIDAPKASILGEGTIDLGEKRYDLLLVPQPRDPGLVSVAVTVQVTGPLDDPQFRPVPLSLGTSLARGLYANAKRPLGAAMRPVETVTQPLGAVWNRLRGTAPESAAPHPCDREDAAGAAP